MGVGIGGGRSTAVTAQTAACAASNTGLLRSAYVTALTSLQSHYNIRKNSLKIDHPVNSSSSA